MLQAKTRITTVRMAVAKLESIPLTPALASTAVRPANRAESNAQWSQFICDFQRIERTTPPSARNAAPLVAEESGLATNATMAATSSVVAKRCKSELGLTVRKQSESFSGTQ